MLFDTDGHGHEADVKAETAKPPSGLRCHFGKLGILNVHGYTTCKNPDDYYRGLNNRIGLWGPLYYKYNKEPPK